MPVTLRLIVSGIIVAALAVTVRAGGAQDPGPAAGGIEAPWSRLFSGQSLFGPTAPAGKPKPIPFARSFTKPALLAARSQTQASTVVCGMTIVKGDASRDPKILHSVAALGAMFKTPVVTPPACQGSAVAEAPVKR